MEPINFEKQINALYQKANKRNENEYQKQKSTSNFGSTLKQTIENVNEISNQADTALKSLSSTKDDELKTELALVGNIHRRMMEVQNNLTALYKKMNLENNT